MDNLIPIIFILIMFVSIISKIKQQKKRMQTGGKPAKPAKPGGLVERINAFLSDVQRQMEEEAAKKRGQGTTDLSEWSQLMDEQETVRPARPTAEESLDDLILEVEAPAPEPKPATAVRTVKPMVRKAPMIKTPPPAPPQPAMAARTEQPVVKESGARKRAELRRAIVWSEILGPPVALRNRRDSHF